MLTQTCKDKYIDFLWCGSFLAAKIVWDHLHSFFAISNVLTCVVISDVHIFFLVSTIYWLLVFLLISVLSSCTQSLYWFSGLHIKNERLNLDNDWFIVLLYRVNEHKWVKSIVLCCLLLYCITLNTYIVPDLCNKHFKCAIFVCVKLICIIIIVSIWKVCMCACHCSLWLVRTASVWTFISIHIQSPVMNDMVLWPQKTNHLSSRAGNKEVWLIWFLFTCHMPMTMVWTIGNFLYCGNVYFCCCCLDTATTMCFITFHIVYLFLLLQK